MKVLLLFIVIIISCLAHAENYYDQRVGVEVYGPALVASVSGGRITTQYIFGYKKSGIFGNREYVDAVITATCKTKEGREISRETHTITLGKEWQGTGFMSTALPAYNFCGHFAYLSKIDVAFTSFGEWDSRLGYNFNFFLHSGVFGNRIIFPAYNHEITDQSWNYIIDFMR